MFIHTVTLGSADMDVHTTVSCNLKMFTFIDGDVVLL